MRKIMSKEVTQTTVKIAKIVTDAAGALQTEVLPQVVLIGNIAAEKAQKEVNKLYPGQSVTVFGIEADTKLYEMEVSEFIKVATLKVEEPAAADAQAATA